MRHYINIIKEAEESWEITLPSYYYRASTMGMRSAYLGGLVRDGIPETIADLVQQGSVSRVYRLTNQTPFKISRTYSGMSNWGFGVYFASDLEWARRYGDCVTVVQISPEDILAIKADDFARRTPGTLGAKLHDKLDAKVGGDASMAEQASAFGAVVRSLKKGAKALYVATEPGRGQICVFGTQAIYPRFYFEIQAEQKP
jgi:hypothetical protein